MDAKALLDSLMGTGRDKPAKEKRDDEWKDKQVCKHFLLKFCPTNENDNWFHNCKVGPVGEVCKKIHSDHLQVEFDKHPDKVKYTRIYEADLLRYLKGLISNADARVAREQSVCKETNAKTRSVVKIPGAMQQQYDQMVADRRHALNDAAMLERGGQGDAAKGPVERAGTLAVDIRKLEEQYTFTSTGDVVCEICGVRCSTDEARNYDGHMTSVLHSAYKRIRDKYKELQEKAKDEPPPEQTEEGTGSDRNDEKDRGRGDKERHRSGDRESGGRRDRGREDRGRDDRGRGDRGSDRNGDRDRDRDRGRGDRGSDRRRSNRSRSR